MAATIQILQVNGATEVETVVSTRVDFFGADKVNASMFSWPITKPVEGASAYSFEVYLKLKVTDLGGSTSISGFKVWYSTTLQEEEDTIWTSAKTSSYVEPTYVAPVNTASSQAVNALPSSAPGSANLGIGGSLAGTITAVDGETDLLVLQVKTEFVTQTPPSRTLHFSYVES